MGETMRQWWTRLRQILVVGVLAAFLFLLELVMGCDIDKEPQVYYGPPPAEDGQGDLGDDAVVYYGP
ncbi:MAG: hypothetical protein FJ098_13435, partial [Deltaproteobacteria bacterium]|nr:hypothetical protein [Deltaproteobacteria bacterium]